MAIQVDPDEKNFTIPPGAVVPDTLTVSQTPGSQVQQPIQEAANHPVTYEINGKTIQAEKPLSDAEIDEIAGAKPASDASVLGELGKSTMTGLYGISQGFADTINALGHGTPDHDTVKKLYDKYQADNKAAVPTMGDIKSSHDAALYAANKIGGMSPYAIAALSGGGIPALATMGAAQQGEEASQQPGANPTSIAAGAGLGAVAGSLPVPFMKGAGGPLSTAARSMLGMGAMGGANAAAANVPSAIVSGDPTDAIPSWDQIGEGVVGGVLGGGAIGGAHGLIGKAISAARQPAPEVTAQDSANQRLAQRISGNAEATDANLNKVNYNAESGVKTTLDNVHNTLAEDIKGTWALIAPDLDPAKASDVNDLLDRTGLLGIIRTAKNKVKGTVSDDDIQTLTDAVGHTEEGRVLVDQVRQSNALTALYQGGLKGGVSQYTDLLNPLGHGGPEKGFIPSGVHAALMIPKLAAAGTVGLLSPHGAATAAMLFGAGRGIDALTGRRSTVAKFVRDNSGTPAPIDFTGARSLLRDNAAAQDAGASQKAWDAYHAQNLKNSLATQKAWDTYHEQKLADARASQKAFDAQATAAAKTRATQAKATAAAAQASAILAREQALRAQNRADNNPGLGGYDRFVHDQTGILPQDAVMGVEELHRVGKITPEEYAAFHNNPRSLMAGNAGNHIIDMLDHMARNGQLQRDPTWQAPTSARPEPPQVGNNPAYEAQAAGNQARVTAAQERVASSDHTEPTKRDINDAVASIGRTNNRQDAGAIRDTVVRSLGHTPDAQALARQELDPLVTQIRHATPEAAANARRQPLETQATSRDSRGRPTSRTRLNPEGAGRILDTLTDAMPREGLTQDVTRGGNAISRLRAQVYKTKAGIDKPAYSGAREPDEGYLKTVTDFHDKAVHDPSSPTVVRSYSALARETIAQFKSLGGLKVETFHGDGEPYRNSKEMMRDVSENHHLWFFPTESGFGNGDTIDHPMLADTGLKTTDGHPLLVNDVFRIVHDFFGHTQHGFQFGPKGEYNAFREHAQMYSDTALPALAAETLAQNAWVNAGPHMRRPDGSLPQPGQSDFIPAPARRFSDQKAYAFPKELIDRDPNLGREITDNGLKYVSALYDQPQEGSIPQGADVRGKLDLRDAIPGFKGIAPFLTPSELELVTKRNAKVIVEHFENLPSAAEMASVAYSGRAKKGWYTNSAKAITSIFGAEDAPKFTALLAALSPQTSIESNLTNALNVWRGWIEADRPRDEASIMRVMGENVEGDRGPGSVLKAWVNNTVRALQADDGPIRISGPKVSSFALNLLGEVNEVTNDTWMANYAGIKQEAFKGAAREPDVVGYVSDKGAGYLAMNALARKAADTLTKRTGETWTPAEIQETVWSWAKALSEKSNSRQSATDIVKSGSLSHDEINSVPDFEKLFVSDVYSRILDQAGYGDYIDGLKDTVEGRTSNDGGNSPGGSPFSAEGSGVSQAALTTHLLGAAGRLDRLKSSGAVTGRIADAADLSSQLDWSPGGGSREIKIGPTRLTYGVARDGKTAEVILISTPKSSRGQGYARAAIEQMTASADQRGIELHLNADPMDDSTTKPRLVRFYQSLGFVRNTGRNKDFATQAEFVRPARSPDAADYPAVQLNPGEFVAAHHDNIDTVNKMVAAMGTDRPARAVPHPDGGGAVVLGPKPTVEYPTAVAPAMKAYTDPEGRQGASSFIAGMAEPDGTMKGLSTPEIRAVAKSIAQVVEGMHLNTNGLYDRTSNSIRVGQNLSPEEHSRVLGHETGHAIEALANVADILGTTKDKDPVKGLQIAKELQAVSRLERPHLWNDAEVEQRFGPSAKAIPEYRTRLDELLADGFRHYMTNPASFKKVAPLAARFMRDLVNPSKIGKVITFTSLAGLALPGIIAQALASFYQGDDKEDA